MTRAIIESVLKDRPAHRGILLAVFREIQRVEGRISVSAIREVAGLLGLSENDVFSAAAFYPAFEVEGLRGQKRHFELEEELDRAFGISLDMGRILSYSADLPGQTRRILAPHSKDFSGTAVARKMKSEEVIQRVREAGLRGAGGAAFPTAVKWETAARTESSQRYVICNAAEGDIGAFVDRAILEQDPESILDGMAISAHAIGATEGVIYLRAEYAYLQPVLEKAIARARAAGVVGSGFDIRVFLAAGMYVCGEETSLIQSMEGRAGHPRAKPPFPAQAGLWGKPSVINNVKTLAHVSWIMQNGSKAFSRGTVVLSICGAIQAPAVVEVPVGTPLRTVLMDICGGPPPGKRIQAVQTGGPLGGLLPEVLLDTPVSFEDMGRVGAPLGSGGMIVFAQDQCMVSVAEKFARFAREESCGFCMPCRFGTQQLEKILTDWTEGRAKPTDLEVTTTIAETMRASSFCAFGQAAPGILQGLKRYFRGELEDHVLRGRCVRGVCPGLHV